MDPVPPNGYVPTLVTKQGERKALSSLSTQVKGALTPLLVAPPPDVDFETGTPKKPIDEHVEKLPQQLVDAWGTSPAFLDAQYLPDGPLTDGSHPLDYITQTALQAGLPLIPIASASRSTAHLAAVSRAMTGLGKREVGIRITADEWPAVHGSTDLNQLLTTLGVTPEQVHLLLDLADETSPVATALAISEIRGLRDADRWKSVILLSTGIPVSMPAGKGVHELGRSDWQLYSNVRTALSGSGGRLPTFGDYAIAGTSLAPEVDPRLLNISGTIRYTIDDHWLVSKGGLYKGPGNTSMGGGAVIEAAAMLSADLRFFSLTHCETEEWVANVADGSRSGGNPTVWREVGTRHHLIFVTEQIAKTFAP